MLQTCAIYRFLAAIVMALLVYQTPALADTVIKLKYIRDSDKRPVSQYYLLLHSKDPALELPDPVAVLLLFPGGGGLLGLEDDRLSVDAQNFLLRTRHLIAAEGPFAVAVADAASEFHNETIFPGGLRGQRTTAPHLEDIRRMIADLRQRFPGKKIWLVGNSRGTISAAHAAAELPVGQGAHGLVLTSPVTVKKPAQGALDDVRLAGVKVPTLILTHRSDKCAVTPPKKARSLKKKLTGTKQVKIKEMKGGSLKISPACKALGPHGFFGIEQKTIRTIGEFITRF
jgi:pimeloyl-ACP methyl ester carboxylesterase